LILGNRNYEIWLSANRSTLGHCRCWNSSGSAGRLVGARNGREHSQPPCPRRENDVEARLPRLSRAGVRCAKDLETQNCFDARPLVARRDPGVELAAGFLLARAIGWTLGEDRFASHHLAPIEEALLSRIPLHLGDCLRNRPTKIFF